MTKVCIASSRNAEIGNRCRGHASLHLPDGYRLCDHPEDCEVFISVLYGHLVSEDFIAKRRCFNFHPGLLPQYRGSGAFSWAIINGDKTCGVTLHELDVDIDTGPIIAVREFPVEAWDTAGSLFVKGMEAIYGLFKEWFVDLLSEHYVGTPQDPAQAHTYYRKDLRAAMDLTRYVRAFTFEGKEPAFYTDRDGVRHEVRW